LGKCAVSPRENLPSCLVLEDDFKRTLDGSLGAKSFAFRAVGAVFGPGNRRFSSHQSKGLGRTMLQAFPASRAFIGIDFRYCHFSLSLFKNIGLPLHLSQKRGAEKQSSSKK
jgi:hypothetical protein